MLQSNVFEFIIYLIYIAHTLLHLYYIDNTSGGKHSLITALYCVLAWSNKPQNVLL